MSASTDPLDATEFTPVSWAEVRDHLVARLMMDPEWLVEAPDALRWWPTPLPMTIEVIGSGTFEGSAENWIRVSGSTLVAEVDESLGRHLACEHGGDYPVGTVVYRDGGLHLMTIYSFNPRNRGLLAWFHETLLIQAAQALELAVQLIELEGVHVPTPPHPQSGERDDVDELVHIYGSGELKLPVDPTPLERFAIIRPELRETILSRGFKTGFSNDEVDFFNLGFSADDPDALPNGAFDFGVGFMHGTDLDRRLGPSLRITARLLPPGVSFDNDEVTYANEALCDLEGTSVFGYVSGRELSQSGSSLWATVPHLTLAEWANLPPEDFHVLVLNAIWHVTAAAQLMRRDVLGIQWPPDDSGAAA